MSKPRTHRLKHVAVLIESSRAYGRGLIEGVVRYSREQKTWRIDFEPRGLEAPPPWLDRWQGDGILARLPNQLCAQAVSAKGLPVVELYSTSTDTQLPMIAGDNAQIARLAFEHFWERGLRQFAYCGLHPEHHHYIAQRGEAFAQLAQSAGCPCAVFPARRTSVAMSDWDLEQDDIAVWLRELPKPVGVLACFDERGFQVLNACRDMGLQVPEQVAVVAVGDDAVLCEMSTPPLSSIDLDAPRIGYEAAALLDRMMRGASAPQSPLWIPPRSLVARGSSDILAVDDADVATALRLIRDRACDGLQVAEVLRQVATSRSLLERKFKQFVGRTPKAHILRIQMDRARQLLLDTNLSLREIAQQTGFTNEKYFSDAFARQVGVRPAALRKQRIGQGHAEVDG
jgi:LacI family transcriptional regulator